MISRTAVAQYVVNNIDIDRDGTVRKVAAWLTTSGRKREVSRLLQDVARLMQSRGSVWVVVTVAHNLDAATQANIERFVRQATGATEVQLEVRIDNSHIGGLQIETPLGSLDASVRAQLTDFVQGVKA